MKQDQTWNAFRWTLAYLLIVLFLLFTSCTAYKLEKQLKPDILNWYNYHAILMDTEAPKWIDEEQRSERFLFLVAPEEFQRYYIKNLFWQVRNEGLGDLFDERLAAIELMKRRGALDDFGERIKIILLCGMPDHIEFIYQDQPTMEPSSNLFTEPDTYQLWFYFTVSQGIHNPTYVFRFTGMNWIREVETLALGGGSDATRLEEYWRKQFEPTEEGWTILALAWKDFQKEEK